jgi:amino acid transporter
MPITKEQKKVLYIKIIVNTLLIFLSAFLMNPTPGQMIFDHKPFHLTWNNIASLIILIFVLFVFPFVKLPRRKSD